MRKVLVLVLLGVVTMSSLALAASVFVVTGIAPRETFETDPLGPGTHRFECLTHPWMRTTVTVD